MAVILPSYKPLWDHASLVGYWPLNTSSVDDKGAIDGTDTNISYVTGKFLQAADFNGTDSKIVMGDNLDPTTQDITIMGWVNFDAIGTGQPAIISKNGFDAVGIFIGTVNNQAKIEASFQSTGVVSSSTINTGEWYHVAVTRFSNAGAEQVKLYINGVLEDTQDNAGYTNLNNSQNFGFGMRQDTASVYRDFLNGKLDEVVYLSTTLSADEIFAYYKFSISGGYFLTNFL